MSNRLVRRSMVALCLITILYLIPSADFNHVFAMQSLKANKIQQSMPQSPGNLTICGQWRYYDRDGNFTPAKYYLVGLYNADTGQPLAFVHTNDAGTYAIGPFPNPGTMIKVKILTDVYYYDPGGNHWITVAPPGGNTWQDAHSYVRPQPSQ
jgi:hypothetical protein